MPKLYFETITTQINIDTGIPYDESDCPCPASCLYDIVNDLFQIADWQLKYEDAQNTIVGLENQLNECMNGTHYKYKGFALLDMDIQNNAVIKQEYIDYIIKYGVPEDGLFLPSLLIDCICDC
jgi:hypothetical protein